MADTMTPLQRHHCMSRIRGRDTRPELVVRHHLWHHGYRYRVCDRRLPGRPDIVLRKWHTVIFVHGCFWHGHDCGAFRLPSTNTQFWRDKVTRNRARDAAVATALQHMGFNVITIWECQLKPAARRATLESLLVTLSHIVIEQTSSLPAHESEVPAAMAAEDEVPYGKEPTT